MSGPALFAEQLRALGYEAKVDGEWVEFGYTAPGGTHAGAEVALAVAVPANFPITPPGGIDFTPRMPGRRVNATAQHPERSHPSKRHGEAGEYWSRPHPAWNAEPKKDARAYLVWINTLWMST